MSVTALVIAMVMVLAMGVTVFADDYGTANSHTITITNTDANGAHSYEAYQVFKGNLNAAEGLLSDITWGTGVDGEAILTALIAANADNNSPLKGKFAGLHEATAASGDTPAQPASSATDVAKAIAALGDNSAELDAVARIINDHLSSTKYAFSGNNTDGYTATVPNDGYYFIKDTTETLPDGDTKSKHMLSVVKDVTIIAKDTSIKPDKEILGGETNVKAGTAAIGDPVQFQVAIQVPDTTNFKKDFWFVMDDTLPAGMTFMQVDSVKTYKATDIDTANGYKVKANATETATLGIPADDASYGYTTTVAAAGTTTYGAYTKPADNDAAVTAAGGQKIKVTFNEFKKFAESGTPQHIGEYVVITYTAVVNDDAVYGATGNKNEVEFKFSNDPNHDYDGDDITDDNVVGKTPKDETKTLVTTIEILKVQGGESASPLAGAEFEIVGTAYNTTLVTAEKFTQDNENGTYWHLKDGSYTNTDPETATNKTQYAEPLTNKYKLEVVTNVVTKPENTKLTLISGADGKIDIKGLKPGTYTITETKAPDGYNKIDTVFKIVVDWVNPTNESTQELKTSGGFSKGTETTESVEMSADGSQFKITIENNKGVELPSTGGMGTRMFYFFGAILVIGAGVLLVVRRRMSIN